jgi:hypothetical protein
MLRLQHVNPTLLFCFRCSRKSYCIERDNFLLQYIRFTFEWQYTDTRCCHVWTSYHIWVSNGNKFKWNTFKCNWLTHKPTTQPTPWSRVLLEKLLATHPVNIFHAFYVSRIFITAFTTTAGHYNPFWAKCVQAKPFHPISLRSILILSFYIHQVLRYFYSLRKQAYLKVSKCGCSWSCARRIHPQGKRCMSWCDTISDTAYNTISQCMFPENVSNETSAHHTVHHIQQRQRFTKPRGQVAAETKFCMLVPNICGCSVWTSLHVTLLAPRILRWLLDFPEHLCVPEQKRNCKTCKILSSEHFCNHQ